VLASFLTPEVWAVLIGVAAGWLLAFLTDLGREEWRARRARKVAALLIYAELTSNLAAVGALRKFGVWTTEREVGPLAGLSRDEVEARIAASDRAMRGPSP
jgi:hypothetical protein